MCDEGYEEGGCCTVGGFVRCNPDSYRMPAFWGEPELPDCMRVEMESESEN